MKQNHMFHVLVCSFLILFIQQFVVSGQMINTENFPLTWQKEAGSRINTSSHSILAPDIQRLNDGSYRAYYTVMAEGVGSAVSEDGLNWTVEEGFRMISLRNDPEYQEGMVGWDLGHPWLVRLTDETWRMFMQANSGIDTPLRIVSAVSADGIDFTLEEGLRVDIGENTGPPALSFAGHGRAMLREDGLWMMVFSGNLWADQNPSDIMLATSSDGLLWQVVDSCVVNNGHDPTLLQLSDKSWVMIFAYLKESLQVCFSEDGLSWSEPETLQLLDENGSIMTDIHGDVALMWRPDGGLRLMGNGLGGVIMSFVPAVSQAAPQAYVPQWFHLYQNIPNPFNPGTTIFWSQSRTGYVKIQIYSTRGQLIRNIAGGLRTTGNHSVLWDGRDNHGKRMPSGLYIYRLTLDGMRTQSKKMMLIE